MNIPHTQDARRPLQMTPRLIWSFIGFLLLASFIVGNKGFYTHWKLAREKTRLQQQVEREQLKCDSLRTEIHDLQDNLSRIEKEARKNGMAAKDEIVINVRKK